MNSRQQVHKSSSSCTTYSLTYNNKKPRISCCNLSHKLPPFIQRWRSKPPMIDGARVKLLYDTGIYLCEMSGAAGPSPPPPSPSLSLNLLTVLTYSWRGRNPSPLKCAIVLTLPHIYNISFWRGEGKWEMGDGRWEGCSSTTITTKLTMQSQYHDDGCCKLFVIITLFVFG